MDISSGKMVSSYPFDGITACSNKSSRDYSFIPWSVHHFLAISGADIQVTYDVPDATWDDYVALRVLTGRDFDVEGLAVIDNTCGKKLNVSRPFSAPQSLRRLLIEERLFCFSSYHWRRIDARHLCLESFHWCRHVSFCSVRERAVFVIITLYRLLTHLFFYFPISTPDITKNGKLKHDKFLSTRGDKVHCSIEDLESNSCLAVDSSVVDASEYRKHDPSGGYEVRMFLTL